MSKIITSLPVDIDSNNTIKTETKDKDIISASIKAPDINKNLLTQEYVMKNCDSDFGSPFFTKMKDCFHYDFRYLPSQPQVYNLLYVPLHALNIKSNTTYTFTIEFSNVFGAFLNPYFLLRLWNGSNELIISYGVIAKSGILSYSFTTPSIQSQNWFIEWKRYNWCNSSSCDFDFKIISLVECDIPLLIETENLYSYSKQSVITSNENNSLGSYQVSPYIRKHIQTIEHNIVKQENQYDINWR